MAITFVVVAIFFFVYDLFVFKRNENLLQQAAQTTSIVMSLFPENVRDRLMEEKQAEYARKHRGKSGMLKAYMKDGDASGTVSNKPLADLFLNTTVLSANICGFTAWSSSREPSQVFQLLETVSYHVLVPSGLQSTQDVSHRNRQTCVFRYTKTLIELQNDAEFSKWKLSEIVTVSCVSNLNAWTGMIGGSQTPPSPAVAASGLPEPCDDHAVTMALFARDINQKMRSLVKELEVSLGPDTTALSLRIGIHTGPVTVRTGRGLCNVRCAFVIRLICCNHP